MKSLATLCLASVVAFAPLPAIAGGTLTNQKAQHAIDQWAPGIGIKTVLGVLENPAQNTATADLMLKGLKWHPPKRDPVIAYALGPGPTDRIYNGKATAHFIHYTDGRWILKGIDIPHAHFDADIVAK